MYYPVRYDRNHNGQYLPYHTQKRTREEIADIDAVLLRRANRRCLPSNSPGSEQKNLEESEAEPGTKENEADSVLWRGRMYQS